MVTSLPFVRRLARQFAAFLPPWTDVDDLVQEGVLGLMDASHRFDRTRGVTFETFARRRVTGAIVDALRRHAVPRKVREHRRARQETCETLCHELGHEPSLAQLAARVGSDERRLTRTLVRTQTIEALAGGRSHAAHLLPAGVVSSPPLAPDAAYEQRETRSRLRAAVARLPSRERLIIDRHYDGETTLTQIGTEIGVTLSRVSALHARAIRHLRETLGSS